MSLTALISEILSQTMVQVREHRFLLPCCSVVLLLLLAVVDSVVIITCIFLPLHYHMARRMPEEIRRASQKTKQSISSTRNPIFCPRGSRDATGTFLPAKHCGSTCPCASEGC